jgi:dipeptidyl aminopeptidase/acylaminoacyl peptidase
MERYADPATEFPLFRLTNPSHESWMPAYYNHAVSRRGHFLVYANDRSGTIQAYSMDLKTGQSHQLTNEGALAPASLALMPDEKSICCLASGSLQLLNLSNIRSRAIYNVAGDFEPGNGFSVSDDGLYTFLAERNGDRHRLRMIPMRGGAATTVVEADEALSDPIPRPRRAGLLYRRGGDLWLVNFDGAQNRKLRLAAGATGPANWSPDGRQVVYLNFPQDKGQLNNLRECTPDTNDDRVIARTTQFVHFGENRDGSVIVGASGSKASPYVLLLVRSVKRELTLCEHKASNPARVAPIFSPDSQRIFFQSDRHGKPAIYAMNVERLVSETDAE